MARTIFDLDAAASFARVIASDLSLYHEAAIVEGLRDGRPFAGLEEELAETRVLFLQRVSPTLDPVPLLLHTFVEFFARWAGERGLPSEGLSQALAVYIASASAKPLALVVRAGLRELGRVVPLADGVLVLGRSRDADVELPSETVAGHHTKLTITGARIEVQDMASHGGTYVNGELVRTTATLTVGDVLQVGTVVLELVRT
jgi:hypothetical protein